jgi:fermentation-respiration switch protein FrsA (DUF1100 family)
MIYQRILLGAASVIVIAAVIYLFSAVYRFLTQSYFVYRPDKEMKRDPFNIRLYFDEIIFKASDGTHLSGWFIPVKNHNGVILVLHGKSGNISTRLAFINYFTRRLGLSTFIIDYRGYGKSEGKPGEEGTYLDSEAAWKYLTEARKIKPGDIIILGRSLGGPIAARLAGKVKARALILESTFTTIKDIVTQMYPYLPIKRFFKFEYPTIDYIKKVQSPVLIIHSSEDDYIPFSHATKLYGAANKPKQFLKIKGSHRNNYLISEDIYIEGIKSFLSRH